MASKLAKSVVSYVISLLTQHISLQTFANVCKRCIPNSMCCIYLASVYRLTLQLLNSFVFLASASNVFLKKKAFVSDTLGKEIRETFRKSMAVQWQTHRKALRMFPKRLRNTLETHGERLSCIFQRFSKPCLKICYLFLSVC